MEKTAEVEKILKIVFNNKNLLITALTHRSYLNEVKNKSIQSNERTEFLGDAILSFWVSNQLFEKFPNLPEGKLTFIRTHLVRTETLAILSKSLNIGSYLLMSKGEEISGGRENPLLLANTFEAVTGSIFLDQGIEAVSAFLERQFGHKIANVQDADSYKDSKSMLQEKIQAKGLPFPVYKLITSEGPDHNKTFTMGVFVEDKLVAEGISRSKQEAEEEAAKRALEIYSEIK